MAKIPTTKKITPLSLTSIFTKGKYVCFSIGSIIEQDPSYISWCIENWENFELDNEAYEKYTRYLDMYNITKLNEY